MTFVHVDIHRITHTCPADPQPHVVDTRRSIVAVIPGGPCRQPITVRLNNMTVKVACGRRLPAERQCAACRITVIERHLTTEYRRDTCPQRPRNGTAA
ncbi:hypothetical protein ACFY36_36050 [Actinoplanes sp. NPDC000266]